MRIDIIGVECPALSGVTVAMQRGTDIVDEHPANGADVRWLLGARLAPGLDLRGPYVHGRKGERFLYLSWARAPNGMFRRAKLMLDAVPREMLIEADQSGLVGRVGLTMPDGSPLCAAVRPPVISWSVLRPATPHETVPTFPEQQTVNR